MSNEPSHRDALPAFENEEEITAFARDYFSSEFPNPSRTGCPPGDDLTRLISKHQLHSEEIRRHLFGCSNCFRIYRDALAVEENEMGMGIVRQALAAIIRPSILIPTTAVAVLLIVFGGWIWHIRDRSRTYVADNSHGYSANPSPQTEQSPNAGPSLIYIDFDNYRVGRGAKKGENPKPEVPRATVKFAITLAEGSPAGEYSILLEDAHGTVVKNLSAQTSDGKTITVDIDLSGLAPKEYRLCVSRKSESPSCYAFKLK